MAYKYLQVYDRLVYVYLDTTIISRLDEIKRDNQEHRKYATPVYTLFPK